MEVWLVTAVVLAALVLGLLVGIGVVVDVVGEGLDVIVMVGNSVLVVVWLVITVVLFVEAVDIVVED